MNEAFEKILERLEELKNHYHKCCLVDYNEGAEVALTEAMLIVQKVAEEYKNSDYAKEIQEMALELAVYVLEEENNKNAWLENANNETGVVITYKDAICIIKDMLKGSETYEEDI